MRISTKVSLAVSALALVVFSAIAAWQAVVEHRDLRRAVERELMLIGRAMRVAAENALRDRQFRDVELTVSALEQIQPDVDVLLFAPDGSLWASSAGAAEARARVAPGLAKAIAGGSPTLTFQEDDAVLLVPLATDHPVGSLALVRPLTDVHRDLEAEILGLMLAVLAFSALAGALVYGLGEALVGRPLARLCAAMARVGGGDFTARLDTARDDEIGQVAGDFAAMLGELEEARAGLVREQDAHRRSQRALQDADRLVTVGQLSAGLAHEIGSPLQVLHGRARRLHRHADEPEVVRRDADAIAEQAARITRIVQQLLDVARHRPRHARGDPRRAVEAVVELLAIEARQSRVRLDLEVAPDAPTIAVASDPLQQIALNLARNALQASAAGGRIVLTLTAGEVQRGAVGPPAASLRLIVDDDGHGIAPEVRPHLYDAFFTTRAAEGGTGLGLAIVHALVNDLGGTIAVRSEVGAGSRFFVDLPLDGAAHPDGEQA
ncbi:MAG: ATP-binding protein [Nannocystaceae bacterium]